MKNDSTYVCFVFAVDTGNSRNWRSIHVWGSKGGVMTQEMSIGHTAGWLKLHHINLRIGIALGPRLTYAMRRTKMGGYSQHVPPQDVVDTCEILAKGSEEDIKARIHWCRMYYPNQFNEPIKGE